MFSIAIDLVHDVRPGKLCSKLWNHESGLFEPPRNLLKLPIISLRYTLHTVSTVPLFNACPSNNAAHFRAPWFFKMKYLLCILYISQYMGSSTFQKGQVHLV
jgi:hypothetical protein